jgi:ubiquinone/menaquinone biosynthesis C-methylase UbiE
MIKGISHITFIVKDLEKTTSFLTQIFDAKDLKFKDESFDNALFSFNGWDQIPERINRLKSLKEAHRILKPGGYFIFTSHIRCLRSWISLWIKQWIKIYILKPLGFKIKEQEFGDVFFKKSGWEEYDNLQYIYIPKLSEILNMIKEAGFSLEYKEFRNKIAPEDSKSLTGNSMFFVCKTSFRQEK